MVEQINPTDSHTLYILVPCIVFLFVPVFFVITRWWSRMLLNGVGIDDWVICVSMVSFEAIRRVFLSTHLTWSHSYSQWRMVQC